MHDDARILSISKSVRHSIRTDGFVSPVLFFPLSYTYICLNKKKLWKSGKNTEQRAATTTRKKNQAIHLTSAATQCAWASIKSVENFSLFASVFYSMQTEKNSNNNNYTNNKSTKTKQNGINNNSSKNRDRQREKEKSNFKSPESDVAQTQRGMRGGQGRGERG